MKHTLPVLLLAFATACSAAPEQQPDGTGDAGADASTGDASSDSSSADATVDSTADVTTDVGRDSAPTDASADAGADAASDAGDDCVDETPTEIAQMPAGLPGSDWTTSPLVVDLQTCENGRHFASLPFGSAWVSVRSTADRCELWLGGETENPMYDGSATQYCNFRRGSCSVSIELGDGGPAYLDSPGCFPTNR